MDRDHVRLLAIGGIVALAVAVIVILVRTDRSHDLVLRVEPVTDNDQITVYIGGAVSAPGLYTLPRGSRVASLIEKSGLIDSADTTKLPMAAELRDGEEIMVPTQSASATAVAAVRAPSPDATPTGLIDINSAPASVLEELPGIGPTLAQRIVDYRGAHGPFPTIDALADVQGISPRMVGEFRDQVTVGP